MQCPEKAAFLSLRPTRRNHGHIRNTNKLYATSAIYQPRCALARGNSIYRAYHQHWGRVAVAIELLISMRQPIQKPPWLGGYKPARRRTPHVTSPRSYTFPRCLGVLGQFCSDFQRSARHPNELDSTLCPHIQNTVGVFADGVNTTKSAYSLHEKVSFQQTALPEIPSDQLSFRPQYRCPQPLTHASSRR